MVIGADVPGTCEAGEDIDNDGSLDDGETDPTDTGSTAEADCAPGDLGFPSCSAALNPGGEGEGEGDGDGPPGVIAGSSVLSCAQADGDGGAPTLAALVGLTFALRRRRRAAGRLA